jgi:hypothetical protein
VRAITLSGPAKPDGTVCSPSLMGSHGVCPLTIMAMVPDICRHMSNVIARAEHEVFLATNFWMYSEPTRLITNVRHRLGLILPREWL